MANLTDELQKQIERNRKLLLEKAIDGGDLLVRDLIAMDIRRAEGFVRNGDLGGMSRMVKVLKEN